MGLLEDEYDDCGSQRSDEKLTFVISLSVKKNATTAGAQTSRVVARFAYN
jgi:hypothetical protein